MFTTLTNIQRVYECEKSSVYMSNVTDWFMLFTEHEPYKNNGNFIAMPYTLIGETFARETFANFGLFRESLSRESFQNGNSRKFIQWNFSETSIRESLSSQILI